MNVDVDNLGPDMGYERVDLRGAVIEDMADAVDTVAHIRIHYPSVRAIIISRSQREHLVKSDPLMYAATLKLQEQFNKPLSDLDFQMVIEKCTVEVD